MGVSMELVDQKTRAYTAGSGGRICDEFVVYAVDDDDKRPVQAHNSEKDWERFDRRGAAVVYAVRVFPKVI